MPTRRPSSTTGSRFTARANMIAAASLSGRPGAIVSAGAVMASPAVTASCLTDVARASSDSPNRRASVACWMTKGACCFARKSASDTTPRTAPSASMTGTPLMRLLTSSCATSLSEVSGRTEITNSVMASRIVLMSSPERAWSRPMTRPGPVSAVRSCASEGHPTRPPGPLGPNGGWRAKMLRFGSFGPRDCVEWLVC